MPSIQVRDMTVQRRENDLVLATFGRGFYILDDYSALRDLTPRRRWATKRGCSRCATRYAYNQLGMSPAGSAGIGPLAGLWTAANPPYGAVFTYHVKQDLPADTKLVLTITDESGKQIRRIDLDKTAGLRRIAWNLRGDPATPAGGAGGGAGAAGGFGGGFGRAAGRRSCPRAVTARRSASWSATRSRPSGRCRRSW